MKRSIIAAAVFSSFFMSAGVFAADVDTGTLTIAILHVGGLILPLIANVAVSEENAGEANP